MKYNKIVTKKDINNKNSFLIACVCSILLLLTMCYFGVNGTVKGTLAAQVCSCPGGGTLSGTTCSNTFYQSKNSCPDGWSGTCEYAGSSLYNCSCTKAASCYDNSVKCDPGYYYSNGKCNYCRAGYYCPGGTFSPSASEAGLHKCKNGTSLAGAKGDSDCIAEKITCDPGTYYSGYGKCETCIKNYYCPGGTFDISSSRSGINMCDYGKISEPGSKECSFCKEGTYYSNGKCELCPAGSYCRGNGATKASCPGFGTSPEGAKSSTECKKLNVGSACSVSFEGSGSVSGTISETVDVNGNSTGLGCIVVAPSTPFKDGYTFIGWGNNGSVTPGLKISATHTNYKAVWELIDKTVFDCLNEYPNTPFSSLDDANEGGKNSCGKDSDSYTIITKSYVNKDGSPGKCYGYKCISIKPETETFVSCEETYPNIRYDSRELAITNAQKKCGNGVSSYDIIEKDYIKTNGGKGVCYGFSCNALVPENPDPTPPSGDNNGQGGPTGGGTTTYTYKATFDANGGTLNGSNTKSCSTTGSSCSITSLPTASKDGYTFTGWGKSSTCTSGSTSSITLSEHTTFYACYSNGSVNNGGSGNNNNGGNNNVTDNPSTGEITIALVWFMGLFSIAYAVYYFKQVKQN